VSELIQRAVELPWANIFSTLIIRFVGVFIVLAILMIGMLALGMIVSRLFPAQEAKKTKQPDSNKEAVALAETPEREAAEEEIAAAIGAALAFSMESIHFARPVLTEAVANGSWALAGRMSLMARRLPAGSQRRIHEGR